MLLPAVTAADVPAPAAVPASAVPPPLLAFPAAGSATGAAADCVPRVMRDFGATFGFGVFFAFAFGFGAAFGSARSRGTVGSAIARVASIGG